jgi:phosphomannomutase
VESIIGAGEVEGPGRAVSMKGASGGKYREDAGAAGRHQELVAAARGVDTRLLGEARPVVVVDCGGGAASAVVPSFLEGCGVDVHLLYCDPDGTFPREPEPLPPALGDLGREVVRREADLGLAIDPDGDRLALVDRNGEPLGEEMTLALAARRALESTEGPVVINLSTSRMIDDVAAGAGTVVVRTPVGEINVVNGMLDCGATIGGEGNGGVIHRDVVAGRDALTGSALILSALAHCGNELDAVMTGIPSYEMLKARYRLPEGGLEELDRYMKELPSRFEEAAIDGRDGVRLDWADRWVHVRPSNTEPVVRIIVEAPGGQEAIDLMEEIASAMDLDSE